MKDEINLPHFLADTWWYALTKRLNDSDFLKLVKLREKQGFNAAQIVVGIPPEVEIEDENAKSIYGSAFDKKGKINYKYLEFAKKRIEIMNEYNLMAIVYGAWGNHIDIIGTKKMKNWWNELIKTLDDLNVVYCLTGEIEIGCKSYKKRIKKWKKVLKEIKKKTQKPILIHTMPDNDSISIEKNIEANTFQTGHDKEREESLWKNIYESKKKYPKKPAINLEPWYEGINNNFYKKEQLKAFWLSVTSGAYAICYGAQGIWNVGDGSFLSHWGNQTFEEALKLDTPNILGKEYKKLLEQGVFDWNKIEIEKEENRLISITRISDEGQKISYKYEE